ncbi:MAG: hypothetical protein ACOYK3_01010 [Flavobacterium sp.]
MDINRLYLELELLDTAILNKIKILLGVEKEELHEITNLPNDNFYGRTYDLSNDSISFHNYISNDTIDYLQTMDTIGGRLSTLFYKINKLEKQTG